MEFIVDMHHAGISLIMDFKEWLISGYVPFALLEEIVKRHIKNLKGSPFLLGLFTKRFRADSYLFLPTCKVEEGSFTVQYFFGVDLRSLIP
jgi:hypothetical protein